MPTATNYYAQGPEALVVSLAARGDRDAFAELVRRLQPRIRNLMRRFTGDPSLADDLSQQVFLKAWSRIRQVRNPERFGPWLNRIAVNAWIDHQRKKGTGWNHHELDDERLAAAPQSTAEAIDLDGALGQLPAPVRLCIVLSYHERLSHAEIAALTEMPVGTIKSHIRRGSNRLRELLSAYGEMQ